MQCPRWRVLRLCLLVVLLVHGVMALEAKAQTSLVAGPAVPVGGGQVEVPILLTTDVEIEYAQLVLDYEISCMDFVEAQLGSAALFGWTITQEYVDDGAFFRIATPGMDHHVLVQLVADDPSAQITGMDQEILVLRFALSPMASSCGLAWDASINAPTGTYPTNLASLESNLLLTPPDMTLSSSGVVMERIMGQVRYFNPPVAPYREITEQDVTVSGAQANLEYSPIEDVTDMSGNYELGPFGLTGAGAPPLGPVIITASRPTIPLRDYPVISGLDAVLLFRHAAGYITFSSDEERAGDVNQDQNTDFVDAISVTYFLAFIMNPSNHAGEWVFNFKRETGVPSPIETQNDATFPIEEKPPPGFPEIVDVRAFLLGDVNGSYGSSPPPKPEAEQQVALSLEMGETDTQETAVSLVANSLGEPLESLVYSLRYDPAELRFEGVTQGAAAVDCYGIDNAREPGLVHGVVIAWKRGIEEPGEILGFRFKNVGDGVTSRLYFDRFQVNDLEVAQPPELQWNPGPATAELNSRFSLSINPNPFVHSTQVMCVIPEHHLAAPVALRVYDIHGRLVRVLYEGDSGPGRIPLAWDGRNDAGIPLASGVYFVRADLGEWSRVEKVSLLK